MPCKAKEVSNKFLNGPGMNSRAFEEKSQKSAKNEIFKNALDFFCRPCTTKRFSIPHRPGPDIRMTDDVMSDYVMDYYIIVKIVELAH